MEKDQCVVTFWGCRGSIAHSNELKMRFSNNTACVSVEVGADIFVFDGGAGILSFEQSIDKQIGKHVEIEKKQHVNRLEKNVHLFLSHYHYDHIEGLPFTSLIHKENFYLYGPGRDSQKVNDILEETFSPPHFPMDAFRLQAANVVTLEETGQLQIGQVLIEYMPVNHPGGCTSFKLSYKDSVFCYLSDYEWQPEKENPVLDFIYQADLLVMDAHFTGRDYQPGWGHSSMEQGANLARLAQVKKCAFFHYNPLYSDNYLDALDLWVRMEDIRFFYAKEKMRINISNH